MTIVLSFLLWAFSQQTASTVEGLVVRDGTNQALVNIQVGLWPTSLEVKTDATGAYQFRDVPPGEYTLVVVHDGIKVKVPVTMNVPQRINATLRVPPAPAISGTVYDPHGERLAAARVQAFRLAYTPSGQRLRAFGETLTNDRGEYRFFWLRPGEYTIGASYSDREQASAADGLRLSSNLSKPDVGYPLVHSQSVDLRPGGEITNVNILLKEAPLVSVSGRLVDSQGMPACARLAVVPLNGAVDGDKDFGPSVCGAFAIRGITPGAYSLLALGKGLASDVVPLNVPNRGVEGLVVELKKTVSVYGRVTLDGSPRPQTGARVLLARDYPNIDQRILADMNPDGSFVVKDVGPGAFYFVVDPLPENTFVAGIRPEASVAGGTARAVRGPVRDVFTSFRFDESTPELNVQLSSAGGVAQGQVVDRAGKPVPGAQVVAAPVSFLRHEDQFKVVTADAVGKFRIGGIAPGSYRVYAFEELAPGAYFALATPAIASLYLNRGELGAFTEGQLRVLRLVAIPASEITGGLR